MFWTRLAIAGASLGAILKLAPGVNVDEGLGERRQLLCTRQAAEEGADPGEDLLEPARLGQAGIGRVGAADGALSRSGVSAINEMSEAAARSRPVSGSSPKISSIVRKIEVWSRTDSSIRPFATQGDTIWDGTRTPNCRKPKPWRLLAAFSGRSPGGSAAGGGTCVPIAPSPSADPYT